MTKNGITCKIDNLTVNLDPKRLEDDAINFVSHAHMDHLPKHGSGKIITSHETSMIAKLRGVNISDSNNTIENFSMLDSGHILGAKGLLFEDIFYTGDISLRDRGFLRGAKIPKCKTLITECTFGKQEFIFPSIDEIVKHVNEIISDAYNRGKPVILLGYELGKAQLISHLFQHWDPLFYHDSIKRMNDLHIQLGINLKNTVGHSEAESMGLLEKKPWVMITPNMSSKNAFILDMKKKYDVITIGFTGWAKSSRSFSSADYTIPLSDHCDFNELMKLVKISGAERIYTIHGFVDEFADELTKKGFYASSLQESSLDNFT